MKMELIAKLVILVVLSLTIGIVAINLLVKKSLSNYKLFAVFSKTFYNYFYTIKKIAHLRTNNFGYAPLDEDISEYPTDLQYGLQLYKELTKVANSDVIKETSTVVEVSCGKGAGAEFLIKKFGPKQFTGVDFSPKAIAFCTNTYLHIKNAHFICADAHQLPFSDSSVDVVINVESSHLYKDSPKFFAEVSRILKGDGIFLYTDYRCVKKYSIERLEKEIANAGFYIDEKRIITPHILSACKLASERRAQLVDDIIPWYLRKYFRHYAVVDGTKKFAMLTTGEIVYVMYRLLKKLGGNE